MCSNICLPTPGSEVSIFVKRINLDSEYGLVELWINLDDGRKHMYAQMKEKIQFPLRRFLGSEGKPGDLCLVSIENIWHRARIVSNQIESYNVFLIDKGKPHLTVCEAMAWGDVENFLLPPETEFCILANIFPLFDEWPELAVKLLKCLPRKKFRAVVQHVLMPERIILIEIPLVSKHMCKIGAAKKMKPDEFKIHVQKCLQQFQEAAPSATLRQEQNLDVDSKIAKQDSYFYPELLTDIFETVTVTEVTDPHHISCQLHIFSKAVKLISKQINQYYEEMPDSEETQTLSSGDPCSAKGTEGKWHRSLLKQNILRRTDTVEVFHVDDGKAELVDVGNIRPLHSKFLRMPVVTYLCSLNGMKAVGEWTVDDTDYLKSVILHQTVVAKFDHSKKCQDTYDVTLYADSVTCVNKMFLDRKGLIESSNPKRDLNIPNDTSSPYSVGSKQFTGVQYEINGTNGMPKESTKSQVVNGGTLDINEKVKDPHPLHPTTLPHVVLNSCNNVFASGESVSVKVSCVESPQRFWCQTTESFPSLKGLMEDLQTHCNSAHQQPLVESICVARNPDNDIWYRAKMIVCNDSPTVHVRFIDYGQTQKVHLRDLHPIDPAFLRLNAQAFQCSLTNPSHAMPACLTDASFKEFQKFVDTSVLSGTGLRCVIKSATTDKDGLPLKVVDLVSTSESASNLLTRKSEELEALKVPLDAYDYSTHNVEVGGEEEVLVTFSDNVNHFYCQLQRNMCVFEELMENIASVVEQPHNSELTPVLNSVCLAKYTDDLWYRGQIVEISPKLKVHFVDYGDTLVVSETDVRTLSLEENSIRSVPVQAISLGLVNIPADVPQEVNKWFADQAVEQYFTMSIVGKEDNGKLIVELFNKSLNLNVLVREKIQKTKSHVIPGLYLQEEEQLSNGSERVLLTNEDCSTQEVEQKTTAQVEVCISNGMCTSPNMSPPAIEQARIYDEHSEQMLDGKTEVQTSNQDLEKTEFPQSPEGNGSVAYKWSEMLGDILEVYASCIVGPNFFWCQNINTETLNKVSKVAQEEGQKQDVIPTEMLKPGTACLALFSSDNQWYRARVKKKTEDTLDVLFVDYGNESEVGIANVRSLSQKLTEIPPQAFLCRLNNFNEFKGSWNDSVYDDFYNLVIDKQIKVTVLGMEIHQETAIPQYNVKAECDEGVINDKMQEYWESTSTEDLTNNATNTINLLQEVKKEAKKIDASKNSLSPMLGRNHVILSSVETMFATCISEPNYFWCQFANSEDLQKISQLAQEAQCTQQDKSFPVTYEPGSVCLALFPSDNLWYRAQVINQVDKNIHVVFVDYGNESDIDIMHIRPLPPNLLEIPPLAFLCRLNGFDACDGSWDDEVYDIFYNLLVDKPLKVKVVDVQDHLEFGVPQCSVEIDCGRENVNFALRKYWKPFAEKCLASNPPQGASFLSDQTTLGTKQIASKGDARSSAFKQPVISRTKAEMVYASCIVDPHFFWCQFANSEELLKLSKVSQEAGRTQQDSDFQKSLRPGSPCLALFPSDNQWYRAQVIKQVGRILHVLFIDYGNESEVECVNVRPLPQNLLEIPPQAFLCLLDGYDKSVGSWDEEVYDYFYNLLVDKLCWLKVFGVKDYPEFSVFQYAVQIECDGVAVNPMIRKYWKAEKTNHISR